MFATKSVHDAVTERSPAYAILAIDSEDRYRDYLAARVTGEGAYNASPYDFQITKNESMMNGFFTRLALTEVNFPWVIPNINGRTNEIIINYKIGAGPVVEDTLTLDPGFYKPAELAAAIQAYVRALDPAMAAFEFTYGGGAPSGEPIYPNFVYSCLPLATYTIAFLPMTYNSEEYPFPATTKQLFDLLGFKQSATNNNSLLAAGGQGGATLCQAVRYIDIVCNQLTYNQALKDTMSQTVVRDTLCRLYLGDGPYTGTSTVQPNDPEYSPPGCAPFVIYRQFTNPKFIRWMPNQPVQGNLRFQVFDDDGQPLEDVVPESVGAENWSMTLLVSED
jgi:hypothetical protein